MKILLVNSHNFGGVEYYRMIKPSHVLSEKYPEFDFVTVDGINRDFITINKEQKFDPVTKKTNTIIYKEDEQPNIPIDDFLKQFDLVHFCRGIDMYNEPNNAERLKRLGIPFGLDLDDYWFLPTTHVLYEDYILRNQDYAIIQAIQAANFVTCTTPILAKSISEFNKNVYVIENGIDDRLEAWQPDFSRCSKMRFGFYQGTTHFEDIKLAAPDIVKVFDDEKLISKAQIVLSGFMSADQTKINEDTGIPQPSFYIGYEKKITDNLRVIKNQTYKEYLTKGISDGNEDWMNESYVRCWGTHVESWGYTYNFSDVSLVPLVNNMFNRNKSELKMIEAGFKGKAVIVSDVNPYRLLATEKNSFLVRNTYTWYKQIKYCIKNPNAVIDKANQLHEDVKSKYKLWDLIEKRKQLYETYK